MLPNVIPFAALHESVIIDLLECVSKPNANERNINCMRDLILCKNKCVQIIWLDWNGSARVFNQNE